MNRLPACECGCLMRDPLARGTRLQHGGPTLCCSAADDDRHAPASDQRAPLDVPAPGELTKQSGQPIEPRVARASEPPPEPQAHLLIEFRHAGSSHRRTSMPPTALE